MVSLFLFILFRCNHPVHFRVACYVFRSTRHANKILMIFMCFFFKKKAFEISVWKFQVIAHFKFQTHSVDNFLSKFDVEYVDSCDLFFLPLKSFCMFLLKTKSKVIYSNATRSIWSKQIFWYFSSSFQDIYLCNIWNLFYINNQNEQIEFSLNVSYCVLKNPSIVMFRYYWFGSFPFALHIYPLSVWVS